MPTTDYHRILQAVLRELDRAGAMQLIEDAERHLPPRECLVLHQMRDAYEPPEKPTKRKAKK